MKKAVVSFVIGTFFTSACFAGTGITAEFEMKNLEKKDPPAIQKFYISGDRLNMQISSGDHTGTVIFRGDRQLMWTIDNSKKEYTEMTRESMAQIASTMSSAMDQLKAQMANMPPEQRAMMEKMMKGQMPEAQGQAEKAPPLTYKKTGVKKTINGFACEKYDVFRGEEKLREQWITAWKNMNDFQEAMPVFDAMGEFFKGMMDTLKNNPAAGSIDNPYSHTKELNGFPVMSVEIKNNVPVMEMTLKSAKKTALSEDLFNPPKGYKANTGFFKPPKAR